MKLRLLFISLVLSGASAFGAEDATFTSANANFAAGKFQEAIAGYEQLVASGKWNANLFYNLGNAYYRAGDFGKAILEYERAIALEPRHAEAEANLRLAREQGRALELRPSAVERYVDFATANQHAVTGAIAFWIAAFALAATMLARRRSLLRGSLLVCMLVVFLGAASGVYILENGAHGANLAIVTAKGVEARLATADTAGSVLALPAGTEIKVLSTRGDWSYVFLPNELRGWIRANAAETVRL